jgi:hypothetical protein
VCFLYFDVYLVLWCVSCILVSILYFGVYLILWYASCTWCASFTLVCILYFGVCLVLWCVSCTVVVLTCFAMCGLFGKMCACIYCVLYCFVYVYFILISFVSTSVRNTATGWKLNCNNNNNNNNNNNTYHAAHYRVHKYQISNIFKTTRNVSYFESDESSPRPFIPCLRSVLILLFIFIPTNKNYKSLLVQFLPCPTHPPALPISGIYSSSVLLKQPSVTLTYTGSSHSTLQFLCSFSIVEVPCHVT